MSTPTKSPRPDLPPPSAVPTSWKTWLFKMGDWIAALSPLGATSYDSSPQAILPAEGFSATGASIRRQGNRTAATGSLVATAGTTFSTAFAKIGTLPPLGSARPPGSRFYSIGIFGAGHLQLQMTNAGDINARALTGTVSMVAGASIYLDGIGWDL